MKTPPEKDRLDSEVERWRSELGRHADLSSDELDELEDHLRILVDEGIAGGAPLAEAWQDAVRRLGTPEALARAWRASRSLELRKRTGPDRSRSRLGARAVAELIQDLRYSARVHARRPGFAVIVVLVLAIGIGLNSAIFSVINGLLFRPLDLDEPEQLVVLAATNPDGRRMDGLSYLDYRDYRREETVIQGLALYFPISMSVRVGDTGEPAPEAPSRIPSAGRTGRTERSRDRESLLAWGSITTVDYFDMLGVEPFAGRFFLPDEGEPLGGHPVVIVSHSFWQSRLGADPRAVGGAITLNGEPFTIIGIAPAGFRGSHALMEFDFWVPLSMAGVVFPGAEEFLEDRKFRNLFAMGRLADGVTLAQARQRFADLARILEQEHPEGNEGFGIDLFPEAEGRFGTGSGQVVALASVVMLGSASLVLLIACVNIANLLLARAAGRRREVSIRMAMGASRFRLVRQLLTESLILALLGGALGVGLAVVASRALISSPSPGSLPLALDVSLDLRVLLYALSVTLASALLFGLGPALQASRSQSTMQSEGRAAGEGRRTRAFRSFLVIAQVATSLVLMVSAGLFARSFKNVTEADVGFVAAGRLRASADLKLYGYDGEQSRRYFRDLEERVAALPGVTSAAVASPMPLDTFGLNGFIYIEEAENSEGRPEAIEILMSGVSADYFETMGTPILRGSDLSSVSADGPRVAVVNRRLASRYWPDREAVGQRFRMGSPTGPWVEVVGVAADGKYRSVAEPPIPFLFLPMEQLETPPTAASLLVHSPLPAASLIEQIRGQARALDDHVVLYDITTLEDHLNSRVFLPAKLAAILVSGFGLLGLCLALVGLYGLMSYAVSSQTREIGVRIALGGTRGDILGRVLLSGMKLVFVGTALGVPLALGAGRLLSGLLFNVDATDPFTFLVVPLVLIGVAIVSCWFPARRATRVDPITALRWE